MIRPLDAISKAIARWYAGEDVPPDNDPRSQFVLLQGRRRYHWSARVARRLVRFYCEHWKWLWAFPAVIATLLSALKKSYH